MATKTKNQVPDLEGKATEIWELHVQCEEFHMRSKEAAREAAMRAWRAGRILNEIKSKLRHGKWLPWLKTELPGLGLATVYRYRKLGESFETEEKIAEAIELNGPLTALYRSIGALGNEAEKEVDPTPDHESGGGDVNIGKTELLHRVLTRLETTRREVESVADKIPIASWDDNEKQRLISTTRALLRIVHSFGWIDDLKASDEFDESAARADESEGGKEVPDVA